MANQVNNIPKNPNGKTYQIYKLDGNSRPWLESVTHSKNGFYYSEDGVRLFDKSWKRPTPYPGLSSMPIKLALRRALQNEQLNSSMPEKAAKSFKN